MKKAITDILVILVILLSILYLFQYIVDKGLRKSKSDGFVNWNNIYTSKINADLIINGNSRAYLMYSPRIIDSILHINSYNLGLYGWTFDMQYARFKIYLKHNIKPKYIIQNVDLNIFIKKWEIWNRSQFLPYFFDSIIINQTNKYEGRFSFAEKCLPMFKYNNETDIMVNGIKSYFDKGPQTLEFKGYLPNDLKWDNQIYLENIKLHINGIIDSESDEAKQQIIEYINYCNANNIKLFFVFAPIYHNAFLFHTNRNKILDTIRKYTSKNNIIFLDYSNDSLSYNSKYFYNSTHLNKKGAEIFSNMLANDLKKYIK